jgi:predicted PurR-regulated permease PerM
LYTEPTGSTPRRRKDDFIDAPSSIAPVESLRDWLEQHPRTPQSIATTGLFVLAVMYTMYFARDFLIPIAVALYLKVVLTPLVRRLRKWNVPYAIGAALVLLATVFTVVWIGYRLLGPANYWLEQAPEVVRRVEGQIHEWNVFISSLSGSTVDARAEPTNPSTIGAVFESTRKFLAMAAITTVLLYLLLASGDLFLRKTITVLPRLDDKVRAVDLSKELERKISRYLITVSLINTGLGLTVACTMYLFAMPNPILWGAMVAVFNFIPYLGALGSFTVLTLAAFVTFDDVGRAFAVGGSFFLLNSIEAYLVTPTILGRRMKMNPVAILVFVVFFGWCWGVAGMLLAGPILVTLKMLCDHIAPLEPVGEYLGG